MTLLDGRFPSILEPLSAAFLLRQTIFILKNFNFGFEMPHLCPYFSEFFQFLNEQKNGRRRSVETMADVRSRSFCVHSRRKMSWFIQLC